MIIYRKGVRVLVQGITGKQGTFWTQKMVDQGTRVVGGVNPRQAGARHLDVPVHASATAAMAETPFDITVLFVPPAAAKDAALDAIQAGAKTVVILTEHIPMRDVLAIHHAARGRGARIIGPNTAGIVTPGEGFVGIMPGHNPNIFQPGAVGVISRSGSLGTLMCLNLTRAGMGQSAFLGIGGDPMIGTTTRDALEALDKDERTRGVVLVGEIGGAMEEEAAVYAAAMRKPVVAFIAGRASPPGKTMGHAGAIVSGVPVADTPADIPRMLRRRLEANQPEPALAGVLY
jgi:succinyl-CoA synthetase alpha subunit